MFEVEHVKSPIYLAELPKQRGDLKRSLFVADQGFSQLMYYVGLAVP